MMWHSRDDWRWVLLAWVGIIVAVTVVLTCLVLWMAGAFHSS